MLFYRKRTFTMGPQGRDIVQIAYHLRQKSPLHFATSHITHSSKVNCTLDKVNRTLCVRKHTILGHALVTFKFRTAFVAFCL